MQELQNVVAAAMANIIESGVIEQTIEKKLTDTVTSIVSDQLRDYSEFGKSLTEAVKASLKVNFGNLGLPGYNDFILKFVGLKVAELAEQSIQTQITTHLENLLAPPPAEIKLTTLVADFIKRNTPYGCVCDGPETITLIVEEESYNSRFIYIDKEAGKSKYSCEYRFGVSMKDGHIFGLVIDQEEVRKKLFVGNFYSFERDLFQMHIAGTKIIIDAEAFEIDTHYPGHGDY